MKQTLAFLICCFLAIKGDQPNERIAGGENTNINQYPFAAALLKSDGGGGGNSGVIVSDAVFTQACGGTIVTTTAILSAASCFYTNNENLDSVSLWRARVGSALASSGGVIHFINRITPHPSFSLTTLDNDLAILRTSVAINFQVGIVGAAHIAGAVFPLSDNQPVWAIGWGATSEQVTSSEQLRVVQFWVVPQQTCANRYNELNFVLTDNMICAGWLDVGLRGQCQGDTGSPLVESGVVVGVFSWSEGCVQARFPSINTRVSRYTRWIVATATAA